jgi:hypothetical protein
MSERPDRLILAVDEVGAPLAGAVALAERLEVPLEVLFVTDAGWAYAGHYPAIGPGGGRLPADAMPRAVRVARRRLEARLAALAGGRITWSVAEVGRLDPERLGRRDLLLLARPRLLASVTEAACSIHLPGPGRGAASPVVAFCLEEGEASVVAARAIAGASRRRFALVHEGTAGVPAPRGAEEGPLWTQRLGARELDVRDWLAAVSPAGVVLPPGAARRLFLALAR